MEFVATELAEALESAQRAMAFDVRDWSLNKRDAWLYGIFCGWKDGLSEVAALHGWDSDTVSRLVRMHEAVKQNSNV